MTTPSPYIRFMNLADQTFSAAAVGDYRTVRNNIGTAIDFPDGSRREINTSIKNEDGLTLLHVAAAGDHPTIVAMLLEQGADAKSTDPELDTALHLAAISGSLRACRILLDAGADPNAQNVSGRTPLHLAVMNERPDIALFLFTRGADPNIRNNFGMSAIVADIVHSRGISAESFVNENAQGRGTIVDIHQRGPDNLTLLHLAAARNRHGLIGSLLDAGADPTLCTTKGKTALKICYENKFNDSAQIIESRLKMIADEKREQERQKHMETLHKLDKLAKPRQGLRRFP